MRRVRYNGWLTGALALAGVIVGGQAPSLWMLQLVAGWLLVACMVGVFVRRAMVAELISDIEHYLASPRRQDRPPPSRSD